jgi:hypothetical protein
LLAAEAAVTAAVAALIAADEAASLADDAADIADEADVSAAEAATADDEAADEAASAAGAVVSAGLLQAARAATATREANRSDLFMNFLEEKFWFEPLPVIRILALTAGILAKDSRRSSSISCA